MRHRLFALAAAAVLAGVAGASSVAAAGPAGQPPGLYEIDAVGAPLLAVNQNTVVLPLVLSDGAARSSVSVTNQPLVVSLASIAWTPVAEPNDNLPQCYAYYPGDPHETSCGGPSQSGPFAVDAGSGHAKASAIDGEPPSAEASVRAQSITPGEGAPAPMSVGQASSAASSAPKDDLLTAGASTHVSDLTVGGVFFVRSVRSSVSGALAGVPERVAHDEQFSIEGAEVAGQPVEIGPDGVTVAGAGSGPVARELQAQVNDALASAGIEVRAVPAPPPAVAEDGTSLRSSSGGLGIRVANSGNGVYDEVLIGQSTLSMYVSNDEPFAGADNAGNAVADVSAGAGGSAPADSRASPSTPVPVPADPPVAGAGTARPSRTPVQRVISAAIPCGWECVYPWFALLVLSTPVLAMTRRTSFARRLSR